MKHYKNDTGIQTDKEEEKRRKIVKIEKEMRRLIPIVTSGRKLMYKIFEKRLKELTKKNYGKY